jgi:hypothetical protein
MHFKQLAVRPGKRQRAHRGHTSARDGAKQREMPRREPAGTNEISKNSQVRERACQFTSNRRPLRGALT